jgi:hypothetical protein
VFALQEGMAREEAGVIDRRREMWRTDTRIDELA